MVSRQEWARMCEPYLTGDSGWFTPVAGALNDYPSDTAVERAIGILIDLYCRLVQIAEDGAHATEDRLEAYRVANQIVGHLAYVDINPLAEGA